MGNVARRVVQIVAALVTVTGLSRPAFAQTSTDHEAAVAEFREARKLIDAGDCAGAMPHLEKSIAREPSVGARMSMAECQETTDVVKAWRSLAEASLLAYTNHDERLPLTDARLVELERRVATFHLGLAPADLVRPGLDVRVDGRPVDRFLLRRGIVAVEPGEHIVEASAAGRGTFTSKVQAPVPGASVLVPIAIPEKEPEPAVVTPPSSTITPIGVGPDPLPMRDGHVIRRAVGYSLGAVGIVGLAVGTVFGVVTLGRASDLDDACGGDRARCERPLFAVASIRDAATSSATASTVSFVVGGAAVAAGIALVLWSPSRSSEHRGASSASVHVTPAGVGMGGVF